MDDIYRTNARQSPAERLDQALRAFKSWRPKVGVRTTHTDEIAESAAALLECTQGCAWVSQLYRGVFRESAHELGLTFMHNTSPFLRMMEEVRDNVSPENWRLLRDQLGDRLYRYRRPWIVSESIWEWHRDWFGFHTNSEQMNAALEDTLLVGFCHDVLLRESVGHERLTLSADLLELWHAGVYPIGIDQRARLVLLDAFESDE